MVIRTGTSTYYVDEKNKIIWGGKLGNKQHVYVYYEPLMMGARAVFHLANGLVLKTSNVEKILAH